VITDGEAKRIEFDDGETVTITELPEAGPVPAANPRYIVPEDFKLEIHDTNGNRIGLTTGERYRAQDGMRPEDC
jgi:hypothetical protein